MKKLIISLFCSFFILFSTQVFSQGNKKPNSGNAYGTDQSSSAFNGETDNSSLSGGTAMSEFSPLGVEGSMYLTDEFEEGEVLLADNSVMEDVKLRYNIFYRQMQFIQDNDTAAFSNPEEIDHFKIKDQVFIHTEYVKGEGIDSDYFQVLTDDYCRLLYRRIVRYHKVADVRSGDEEKEVFVNCCEFYVKKGDAPAQKVCLNKKSVCCAFKDKEEEVTAFIKTNKLKMKTREDLVRVIEFYNKLI